jgi:hypothetical protein
MNADLNRWQANNDRFLAEALNWLRLELACLAETSVPQPVLVQAEPEHPAHPVAMPSSGRQRLFAFLSGKTPAPVVDPPQEPVHVRNSHAPDSKEAGAQARVRMDAAADVDPPPALDILAARLGLSAFERNTLLLCAAMEMDTGLGALCARVLADPNRPYPTFALALALFEDAAWDVMSPERPLRHWRLIEVHQTGGAPLTTSALRADERIVNYLKGLNYLDDRLVPLMVPFDAAPAMDGLPPSQKAAAGLTVRYIHEAAAGGLPTLIQLVGADPLSKQLVAWEAAAELGLQVYRMPVELLPHQAEDLETLARLWQRESILLPLALYLDAHDVDGAAPSEGQAPPLHRFLARSDGVFFLGVREIRTGLLGATTTAVEVDKPTPTEQQAAWCDWLGPSVDGVPTLLAGQFNLNLPTIRQIARSAASADGGDGVLVRERAWSACLANTRPRLDLLARRLDPKATWEDIVLPPEVTDLLRQIAAQVAQRSRVYDEWGFRDRMNRGLGINALFAGESGTGKTMAAEVLANELHLNIYHIDLSAVVSKYIGETEKNLRRLFDAAEDGGALLFFDEADALFGKRSEVKDSHDRYANIEVNYLLQRMEAYRGLAILATNMKSALDQAFLRRLRFVVLFPFPTQQDRARIWRKVFPPQTPLSGVDFDRLAALNVPGGAIANIALNAAFLAAQAGQPVTMPILFAAAQTELRKLERPVREADFRWTESAVR